MLLLISCCALFVPAKADFVISQTDYTKNLIAGMRITQNITFEFQTSNLNTISGFHITTTVVPDSLGIDVTYSNMPKMLLSNMVYTIQMHINTSMLLAPGQYIITSTVYADQETPAPIRRHVHASSGNPVIPPPSDNPTDNPTPGEEQNETNDTILPIIPPPAEQPSYWLPIIMFAFIAFCIILLIFLILRKRKKET